MSAGDGPLFVAVDVGTTGARASAVDLEGALISEARQAYDTATPQPGWAEQDPRDWQRCSLDALAQLSGAIAGRPVAAVGLTGQCPTVAPMDAKRHPVGPGLLYRDNRAGPQAAQMRLRIGEERMHERTGHLAEAFHVGPKVLWLRDHEPAVFAVTDCFMQPRDVALHALTAVSATDETHGHSQRFRHLFRIQRRTLCLRQMPPERNQLVRRYALIGNINYGRFASWDDTAACACPSIGDALPSARANSAAVASVLSTAPIEPPLLHCSRGKNCKICLPNFPQINTYPAGCI